MALPLLPLAVLGAGGFMLFRGLRGGASSEAGAAKQFATVAAQAAENARRKPNIGRLQVSFTQAILAAHQRTGAELAGAPQGPALDVVASPFIVQPFKRANGERTAIYFGRGAQRAHLVRGGFYKVFAGRERVFGLPTSDERAVGRVQIRMGGKSYQIVRQDFERGFMVYDPSTGRSRGYWLPGGERGAKFVIYDSKPKRAAWYESAWAAIQEDVTLGDIAFALVVVTAVVGTAAACATIVGCLPAIGATVLLNSSAACKARDTVEGFAKQGAGLTGKTCGVVHKVEALASMSSPSGEEDAEPTVD